MQTEAGEARVPTRWQLRAELLREHGILIRDGALAGYERYGLVHTTRGGGAPPAWPPREQFERVPGFADAVRPGAGWERVPVVRTPEGGIEVRLLTPLERLVEA